MKTTTRTIALVLLMFFAFVATASAQTSWLPPYNASQRVYVAPGVDATAASAFQTPDFTSKLSQAAAAHSLDVYVVATATGSDVGSGPAGPVLVRKLWDNWSSDSKFKKGRALVILLTGDGQKFVSVGVRAGDYLNSLGIARNTMSDANGPVIPVIRANLPGNPAAVPIRITENINAIVAAKTPTHTPAPPSTGSSNFSPPAKTTSEGGISTLGILAIVGLVVSVVVLLVVVINRSSRTSSYTPPTQNRPRSSGFQNRMDDARRHRTTGSTTTNPTTTGDTNDGGNNIAAAAAGAVGGYILADQLAKRDKKKDDDTVVSGGYDGGSTYVAPSCSTPSTPSCSSPSCSSGSSCGGGGGCGGGGCGGGS